MAAKKRSLEATEIKDLRESLRFTQAKFSRTIGVATQVVSDWEGDRKKPGPGSYIKMAKVAPRPACWFFFDKAGLNRSDMNRLLHGTQAGVLDRVEKQQIPEIKVLPAPKLKDGGLHSPSKAGYFWVAVLNDPAAAGAPRLVEESEVESYILVPASQTHRGPEWIICIRVQGDSMEPILKERHIVCVDTSVTDPRKLQQKMVVAYVDEGVTIKHLDRVGNQWVLTPENKTYRPQPLGRDDRIIGRVAWWYGHQK